LINLSKNFKQQKAIQIIEKYSNPIKPKPLNLNLQYPNSIPNPLNLNLQHPNSIPNPLNLNLNLNLNLLLLHPNPAT
jgi:hypothetical protein